MRFFSGKLTYYEGSSSWRPEWELPGPTHCHCGAEFGFWEDACSCRPCSKELEPEDIMSVHEAMIVGHPAHTMDSVAGFGNSKEHSCSAKGDAD